jgi:hypothetical protein
VTIKTQKMEDEDLKYIKDLIQSANLNFLIGSGFSQPYLKTLGNIENHISEVYSIDDLGESVKSFVLASIFNKYFIDVMYSNKCIIDECKSKDKDITSQYYIDFITIFNILLQKRGSTILNKQINIFTTNIDIFLDKTLEDLGLEFNDGFSGRFLPIFNLSNYNKIVSKKSLHFENESRIPVFNLLKLHGSLNWRYETDNKITYSTDLKVLEELKSISDICDFIDIDDKDTTYNIIIKAENKFKKGKIMEKAIKKFIAKYETIPIVNPTKEKFKETVLDLNYYELLRYYANELEKENTVLFVLGFSMADEHIAEITLRLAKSNPTMTILIFAYDEEAKNSIIKNLKNTKLENIKFYAPDKDDEAYSFEAINRLVFHPILNRIISNE